MEKVGLSTRAWRRGSVIRTRSQKQIQTGLWYWDTKDHTVKEMHRTALHELCRLLSCRAWIRTQFLHLIGLLLHTEGMRISLAKHMYQASYRAPAMKPFPSRRWCWSWHSGTVAHSYYIFSSYLHMSFFQCTLELQKENMNLVAEIHLGTIPEVIPEFGPFRSNRSAFQDIKSGTFYFYSQFNLNRAVLRFAEESHEGIV